MSLPTLEARLGQSPESDTPTCFDQSESSEEANGFERHSMSPQYFCTQKNCNLHQLTKKHVHVHVATAESLYGKKMQLTMLIQACDLN